MITSQQYLKPESNESLVIPAEVPWPDNTTSTRFNATKHGLLAVGITERDDAQGHRTILSDLIREKSGWHNGNVFRRVRGFGYFDSPAR
jgi:hypothetical protein